MMVARLGCPSATPLDPLRDAVALKFDHELVRDPQALSEPSSASSKDVSPVETLTSLGLRLPCPPTDDSPLFEADRVDEKLGRADGCLSPSESLDSSSSCMSSGFDNTAPPASMTSSVDPTTAVCRLYPFDGRACGRRGMGKGGDEGGRVGAASVVARAERAERVSASASKRDSLCSITPPASGESDPSTPAKGVGLVIRPLACAAWCSQRRCKAAHCSAESPVRLPTPSPLPSPAHTRSSLGGRRAPNLFARERTTHLV